MATLLGWGVRWSDGHNIAEPGRHMATVISPLLSAAGWGQVSLKSLWIPKMGFLFFTLLGVLRLPAFVFT